ncbi:beta strand repeat-containing protein, partial [Desulfovibrio sp. 1214_IL3152]|uniref:beta strand repeat-containing protein n=1 Tax=Desulfovibrio sp. 1214_IL3152 TaxID=3084056 RepID=UPI002FD9B306
MGPDLAPAAGPEATRSARYSEMGNADLASGIDHLDGLDMSIPGSAVSMEGQLAAPLMNLGAGNYSGPGSEEGPTVPPIEQSFVADVRAVMYNTGPNSADHVVTTPIFFKNADGSVLNLAGAPAGSYAVSWSFPADWDSSWLADPVMENGQLIFKLSPEGLQMLQQTGDDSFLRGFVTVTVTMNGQTSEYKVEVVGTQGTYFNSADYDEQYGAVSGLGTDYIGEYHQGSGQNGSYHITSSSKNNDIVLNDSLIGGSYVHASGNPSDMGHDFNTVLMNKGVINTGGATAVTSYDGTLRVHEGISAEGSAASNSIDMGKGQIHVSNDSGHGVSASQGVNTISGNQILVEGNGTGVYAESGGQNSIINTGGKTLVITGEDEGVYAYGAGSSNHISNQQGTVDITGQTLEGLAATSNGANYVFGKDVNITGASGQAVPGGGTAGAAGIFASGGSSNEVTAINGDVTVKGHKGLEAVSGGSNDVSVEGQGNITVEGELFGAGALNQSSNNTLTAEQGTVTVTASNGSALLAADGSNEVTGRNVDISGSASGLNASGVGSNTVTGTGGSITIKGDSSAVFAGNNTGNTSSDVHVGNKIIGEGDTAITIEGGTTGMNATGGGRNEVSGTGSNVVTVTGWLDGMSANGSLSANSILADEGTVNVTGQFGEGLAAVSGGANYIIGKDINIASGVADSENGQFESFGAGLFATKAGINEVTAINGDVEIKGLRGMEALNAGSNDVSVEGQGNITVTGQQFGVGALNQSSNNTLTAEQGAITVTASDGEALLAADGSNEVTGRNVDISGSTSGLNASGV